MAYQTIPAIPSLKLGLELTNAEPLKKFVTLITGQRAGGRKDELVHRIQTLMQDDKILKELWSRLDPIQQTAVAETVHSDSPHFDGSRFKAKHGSLPKWGSLNSYKPEPNLLNLFFFPQTMPEDLKTRLKAFVPIPDKAKLPASDHVPGTVDRQSQKWDAQNRRTVVEIGAVEVIIVETATAALHDLRTVLGLVESGKVTVSDTTRLPTAAGVRTIRSRLADGDFYHDAQDRDPFDTIGSIKAFAWPLIVQGAGLANTSGTKLQLSREGEKALGAAPENTLRQAWKRWRDNKLFDEFRRIDAIKGQTGKGRTGFTATATRRAMIHDALLACPVGRWVEIEDLFRFMRASDLDFQVHRNPWNLYISEAHYGSLGYEGSHDWEVMQGRYVLCVLFEYAATMGLIDVAFTHPQGARSDYRENWGTDDLSFFSRYDGLLHIRLNPLGAYCLGATDRYVSTVPEPSENLKVLPNLDLVLTGGVTPQADLLMLETYAVKTSDVVWRLDQGKLLDLVESGQGFSRFVEWLKARSVGELPDTVQQFLTDVEKRATALKPLGMAKMIECANPALAALIANDVKTGKYCALAGSRDLVVPVEVEGRFRTAVRKLGYCLPKQGS